MIRFNSNLSNIALSLHSIHHLSKATASHIAYYINWARPYVSTNWLKSLDIHEYTGQEVFEHFKTKEGEKHFCPDGRHINYQAIDTEHVYYTIWPIVHKDSSLTYVFYKGDLYPL